jgi:ferredoxin
LWPQFGSDAPERYALAGIMLGWFEVFLSDGKETPEQQEFARRLDRLFKSWGKFNVFPLRNLLNSRVRRSRPQQSIVALRSTDAAQAIRTIPVDQPVEISPVKVYTGKTVRELIEKHGDNNSIALLHCFCRQYHKMIDEPCRFEPPPESCMAIGEMSHHALKQGVGRLITKEEARALIDTLQEKGVVHQVFHADEDTDKPEIAICNCCWDCCGVFGSYNRGIMPLHLKTFFEARLSDPEACQGCGTCVDYCPVNAIALADDKSRIDAAKCIGCGQCELQCPEDAISLLPNERTVMLPLVKTSEARISWQ